MKIFLAGVAPWRGGNDRLYDNAIKKFKPYHLESFYYTDADTERLLPFMGDFLLDSGAFSFMEGAKAVDWDEYIERYAHFIVRNKIQKFFELDVDSVVGYRKVLELRHKLEKQVGRQCIPVWHISRGKDEFIKHCKEYPYVALGGIVSGEWQTDSYFPWFISEAHKYGAKIHGLGYTKLRNLGKYHFDSVDSTAWTTGNRYGYIYKFNGKTMVKKDPPKGNRIAKPKEAALINYMEWVKFQKYAETHL